MITYFYRRVFELLRRSGFQALISTNSVSQGTSRENGLEVIRSQSGTINFAAPSVRWPGAAEVVVSLVALCKGKLDGSKFLNNQEVLAISTSLDDSDTKLQPIRLKQNEGKSFMGCTVVGQGFILTPEEAQILLDKDSRNSDVIFPYLNGNDLNSTPYQKAKRFIINFFEWPLDRAKEYTDCFSIVEEKVKAERQSKKYSKNTREFWWRFHRAATELYEAVSKLNRVLVVAQVSKTVAFAFVETDQVFDAKLIIFATDVPNNFAIMQSSFHFHWAWKYCTTMKTDLSYGPSRIFEPFPFPKCMAAQIECELDDIGEEYHEFRRQLMLKMQLGLTKTYNQFHNPDLHELSEDDISKIGTLNTKEIQKQYGKDTVSLWKHLDKTEGTCRFNEAVHDILHLRELHKHMDESVLRAYGWHQETKYGLAINLAHDFYEVDYLPENDRVRYTISPKARKEVLKRLLLLNHEIYEDEVRRGLHDKKKAKSGKGKKKATDSMQIKMDIQ